MAYNQICNQHSQITVAQSKTHTSTSPASLLGAPVWAAAPLCLHPAHSCNGAAAPVCLAAVWRTTTKMCETDATDHDTQGHRLHVSLSQTHAHTHTLTCDGMEAEAPMRGMPYLCCPCSKSDTGSTLGEVLRGPCSVCVECVCSEF